MDRSGCITPCACGAVHAPEAGGIGRRSLLAGAGAAAALAALPFRVMAAGDGPYRAMLLSCIDPRTQIPIASWMDAPFAGSHTASLTGEYSQFTIAGAGIAPIAPAFAAWRPAFWDNLAATISLHHIDTLIVVDHGNCGALGIAYGSHVLQDPALELKLHTRDTMALRHEVKQRHPKLGYQAYMVDRDAQGAFTVWRSLVEGPPIA